MVFTSCLVLAFAYTSTQDDRGMKSNFFILTIPSQWIPYAMLLMTLVTGGPTATKIQATGLIAAHLHDFLTRLWPDFGGGTNLIPTPTFIRNIFAKPHATVKHKPYGTAFAQPERAGSRSDGVLPESWKNRGSGHRLGGN
jgi:Derlin-2/3